MLDLRRLRALRELADHGTIAAAADALHLTASAVSQQITALEREVGAPMVERHGRTVRLTPAAEVVLGHADAVFAQLEQLRADLDSQSGGAFTEVRVAAFPTGISGLVVPAARALRAYPGLSLRVEEHEAPGAFRALAAGNVDLAISMECDDAPQASDPRFTRVDLRRDVLDAALPIDHPLADAPDLALRALAAEAWIAPPEGWSCDQVVQAGCRASGFAPDVRHRSSDWSAVLAMVGAGLGVSLVPRLAQIAPPPDVAIRPIAGEPPCRHLFVACARGAEGRPALRAVIEALREVRQSQGAELTLEAV